MKEVYPTVPDGGEEDAPELSSGAVNTNETRRAVDRALQYGTTEDLMTLLDENGFHPDSEDFEGRTALMVCTASGKKDVVEILLTRGADVNHVIMYQGRIPMSALDAAYQMNREEIADLLLSYGAKTGREIMDDEEQEAAN